MSIRKRILNVARAEIKSAAKKAAHLFEGSGGQGDSADEKRVLEELEQLQKERAGERKTPPPRRKSSLGETEQIRRYYANLELPIGASLAEVKASYRRLMRRYHPDLHQSDGERAQVATKLAQELRVAYEALVAHLEPNER